MRATIALLGCLVLLAVGCDSIREPSGLTVDMGEWHQADDSLELYRKALVCLGEVEKYGLRRRKARQAVFDGCMAESGWINQMDLAFGGSSIVFKDFNILE